MLRKLLILIPILATAVAADEPTRRMAVTIDDLPAVSVLENSAAGYADMTSRLLGGLSTRSIPAIGFVNESQFHNDGVIDQEVADLLRQWLNLGFDLGNHSFSHFDLHRISLEEFKKDVIRGESITRPMLQEYGKKLEYFRHPYLHTGTSLETKLNLERFLDNNEYRVAPVSIDNSDWIFARAYVVALKAKNQDLAQKIGQDYVDYMLRVVSFYEGQSQILFDKNIAHVLLIHANELNADWFALLADELTNIGYQFISLDEALEDKAYVSDDTYIGSGGISWLHRWALTRNVDRAMFEGEPVPPEYVLELTQN